MPIACDLRDRAGRIAATMRMPGGQIGVVAAAESYEAAVLDGALLDVLEERENPGPGAAPASWRVAPARRWHGHPSAAARSSTLASHGKRRDEGMWAERRVEQSREGAAGRTPGERGR